MPNHWRIFDARVSSLTGSPRLATNPVNAILNYLYAVLESETRLAVAALGLDPGLGVFHVDTQFRDSLAFDVMEPIRPKIDAYLLQWIRRRDSEARMVFRATKRQLPADGIVCGPTFGNSDRMGASRCSGRRASG